jgi:hypothetical protein
MTNPPIVQFLTGDRYIAAKIPARARHMVKIQKGVSNAQHYKFHTSGYNTKLIVILELQAVM